MALFTPTEPRHWEEYKDRIIDLYLGQNMELARMASRMREFHRFNATPRMYIPRLHAWGHRRYLTEKMREDLCSQVLEDFRSGRDVSWVTCKEIKKLIRHCKSKDPSPNPQVLEDLRAIELVVCSADHQPQTSQNEEQSTSRASSQSSVTDFLAAGNLDDTDDGATIEENFNLSGSNDEASDVSGFSYLGIADEPDMQLDDDYSCFSSVLDVPTPTQTTTFQDDLMVADWSTNLPPSLINMFAQIADDESAHVQIPMHISFGGTALAMESLLHLAHSYYTARLSENASVTDLSAILPNDSKSFWTSVKSAIYLLKNKDETFAFPILQEVSPLIPRIAAMKPLSLLRELLTTLSIVNTEICPGLRGELLRIFARSAYSPGQVDIHLHRLCVMLRQDWVNDEVLTVVLCGILRLAETHLGPHNNEVAELHRARIQLLRRRNDTVAADQVAVDAKRVMESFYGGDSVQTRLIMSEQIYILNKRQRLEESLVVAKDVVDRAQRDDGIGFPSDRSIYHIEDLAEIYENLGRPNDAIHWLRRALKAALNNWNNRPHAISLNNKLEKLYAGTQVDG